MKTQFEPEFGYFYPHDFDRESSERLYKASEVDNWLAELKATAPVVYGYRMKQITGELYWVMGEMSGNPSNTHRAYLIGIEEIKPKECEHEAAMVQDCESALPGIAFACKHCGVKLKAKWEVAK